ncbi:MAG: metallopeptidase [Leptothrix sp. (in: Bacteria)]|nr:metallopeptidase [Leptothrix sp. (in: b-proteobacteria)]
MESPVPTSLHAFPGRLAALAAAAAALSLGACATAPTGGTPAASAAAPAKAASAPGAGASAPAGGSAAARPDPSAPKAFAEVIKDAKRQDGFVPLWRKDEKVWLEIAPERIGKPMLMSINVAESVGERGLYASQMGPRWMVEFRKIGNQVQIVAQQLAFRAPNDPASGRSVGQAFSDSLIGATAVASAAHPERKSVLIDAGFLLGDLAGYSTMLETAFRMPYSPDRANSFFEDVRAEAGLTTLAAKVHYAVPRIPARPLLSPGAPPPLTPPPPATPPDARSFFIGYVYNFRELPAAPMTPRAADPRVGYFTDSYTDLSNDFRANPKVHNIKRWRLEKKDPQAALSEPVAPITFWMDRNIPVRYRKAVEAGIVEWNKAFERIGYKNAVVARQQPDDAKFDLMDAGHASIRWFVGADVGFAQGPSHSDPRTGEILDADIRMADVFGRGARRQARDDLHAADGVPLGSTQRPAWRAGLDALQGTDACTYAQDGANEMSFALDLLEARGELDPDSPETEEFVQNYIKDVITHEVGHTLGLRHNFKSSTTVSRDELRAIEKGTGRSISGSVMDYNAFNLPLQGEPKRQLNMTTLGAYDYWAIEYGYKPVDPAKPEQLAAIVERSRSDKALVFADDGDNQGDGLDPLVNVFDLGDNPLAYAQRRLALSKELWTRVQARQPKAGDDPERARRSVLAGFRQVAPLPAIAAKYVGGMHTERDLPGTGKPAFRPVEPAMQRAALSFLTQEIFSNDSFSFKPEFLQTLQPDYIEFIRPGPLSVPQAVLTLQTQALDRLLSPGTAGRLLELPNYLPEAQRRNAISLNELYGTLQGAVWSELKSGKEIDSLRRSLQREHLKRLQGLLTRPMPTLPADAVSLARLHATALQGQLRAALGRKGGMAVENRAHLEDALALVTEALRATLQRS